MSDLLELADEYCLLPAPLPDPDTRRPLEVIDDEVGALLGIAVPDRMEGIYAFGHALMPEGSDHLTTSDGSGGESTVTVAGQDFTATAETGERALRAAALRARASL